MNKIRIIIGLVLILFGYTTFVQGQWDISPADTLYEHAPGDSFAVELMLSGSGSDIDALGFDFYFPESLLQYSKSDFSGTLLENWMFKDVNHLSTGRIRIAGFTTSNIITSPTAGVLLKLIFIVNEGPENEGLFYLDGLKDDIADATSDSATFKVKIGTGVHSSSLNPQKYALFQNYPNPFNSDTEILYELPKAGHVKISIYNLLGHEICVLVNDHKDVGYHSINWDGKNKNGNQVASGMYFYKMQAGNFNAVKKLITLK